MLPQTASEQVPLPEFVQIEPVGQCNLSCRMCPVSLRGNTGPGKRPAFMPFESFCAVLEQFPAVRRLQLQGMGEPFLHPRFFDMVRHAAARGIEVCANTNLTALSPRRAALCVESGLAELFISLDAAEAAAYEYIRVGAKFSRVLRNLGWLMEAKRRASPRVEPRLTLVVVAMRRNLDQLPQLVRLASEFGVPAVSVQRLAHDFSENTLPPQYAPMRRFVDAETLAAEEPQRVAEVFDRARETAAALGVALHLPAVEPRAKRGCDWPWRGAYIAYSGEAMPCCMIATPDRLNFGNVAAEGVANVWNGAAYNEFRNRLASDEPPAVCRGCAVYNGTF
jgi:radical SAM protein with 4Fe4S-binding SPASM domain